ncbi:MAG: hypothetical protein Q8K86_10750 [Candidatus Nanopelagicaceae bacterium]|nr:hypothetical protein [Candidatus Nanopelagicaceae bacterium]
MWIETATEKEIKKVYDWLLKSTALVFSPANPLTIRVTAGPTNDDENVFYLSASNLTDLATFVKFVATNTDPFDRMCRCIAEGLNNVD